MCRKTVLQTPDNGDFAQKSAKMSYPINDPLNRMVSLTASGMGTTQYFYDAVGNRDSVRNANGTSVGYTYDNLNRLVNVTNYGTGGTVISSYTYTLNNAGIRTAVSEADGSRVDYGYDAAYKLTSETRTGTHPYTIAYTYDNVGNRLTQTKDGVLTSYAYNNRDQLTGKTGPNSVSYVYDNAGRMTNKTDNAGATNYTWIDNDRMASVTGPGVLVNYAYDHNGQRVSETTAGGTKKYLIDYQLPYGQVVAETDGDGNLVAGYVYGLERISMTRGVNTYTFNADGQGSTRQLTDASGNVTDGWLFDAFGNTISRTGTTVNPFQYVGEAFDPNSEFYNLRARWYNPTNGTFTSVDPFEGDPQAPVSLHRYLYANANPICYNDPSGETILSDFLNQGFIRNLIQKADPKYLSAMIFGTFAHYQIYLDVKKTYTSAMYNVPIPGAGVADIVINPHLYEIKPEKGTQSAEDQLYRYVKASGGRYIPGEIPLGGIIKDPLPLIGIQIEYFMEAPGIIYYRPGISTSAINMTIAAIILPMAIRQIQLIVSQMAIAPGFGF